mmetsp:Transcript_6158/g.9128  ORF Transcript_6158/g.9128 Transcript_6158/m.9128 type:complete len:243 (+) Transcript_6158:105-833(+)
MSYIVRWKKVTRPYPLSKWYKWNGNVLPNLPLLLHGPHLLLLFLTSSPLVVKTPGKNNIPPKTKNYLLSLRNYNIKPKQWESIILPHLIPYLLLPNVTNKKKKRIKTKSHHRRCLLPNLSNAIKNYYISNIWCLDRKVLKLFLLWIRLVICIFLKGMFRILFCIILKHWILCNDEHTRRKRNIIINNVVLRYGIKWERCIYKRINLIWPWNIFNMPCNYSNSNSNPPLLKIQKLLKKIYAQH